MEPQPTSNPYDRPPLTDEQKRAAEAKRKEMILEIMKQVYKTGEDEEQAVYHKHNNVYYPHEVQALPDEQKQALAETIVAWSKAPENSGILATLSTERVLEYIERNEVFAYIADGELLACASLHPDMEHQIDGRGRVVFGMAMKRPASFATTESPEAASAFKRLAGAQLVLCANVYPNLRPRAYISSSNERVTKYLLITLGLDEIRPDDPKPGYSPINVKLNQLVDPLKYDKLVDPPKGAKLPPEVIRPYKHVLTSEPDPESSSG